MASLLPVLPRRSLRRMSARLLPARCLLAAMSLSAALMTPLTARPPARAIEIGGRTYFASPPVQLRFRSFYSFAWQRGGEYYFSVVLPLNAGVGLGGLMIEQTSGVDRRFEFALERSRAFLGEPRREGPALPVTVSFDPLARRFQVRFPEPVAPGQTVTLALRPWANPASADTYMFAVHAYPAGPEPQGTLVGFARMPIFNGTDW